jgi:hypothetical protein
MEPIPEYRASSFVRSKAMVAHVTSTKKPCATAEILYDYTTTNGVSPYVK